VISRLARSRALTITAGIVVLTGAAMCIAVPLLPDDLPAPQPSAVQLAGTPGPTASAQAAAAPSVSAGPLPPPATLTFSVPVQLAIPAIGVRARVEPLGKNRDGTVEVPPLSRPQLTSWFDDGPAPGQTGPADLYGHVEGAAAGPAVFYRLGDLVPGDTIDITRADHRVAVFTVYQVSEYPESAFPAMTVYANTSDPELRLITCDTAASPDTHTDTTVVYARLTSVTAT